jgi:adenylate kinase
VAGAAETLPRLRLLLFGPPGSGKGTQAAALSQRLTVPAISTGEMLRQAVVRGTELGRKVEAVMATGSLVDDAAMAEVVRQRLDHADARNGFLLDGYPRTLPQAETLEEILAGQGQSLDAAVFLEVPDKELVRRTSGRQRADDREEVVRERLRVYTEKTAPLVGYYRQRGLLRQIDGNRPVVEVGEAILAALLAPARSAELTLGAGNPARRAV